MSRLNKTVRASVYSLLGLCVLYFTLMFSFGGFGQKAISLNLPEGPHGKRIFFAHRGISFYYPENTLLAIQKAKEIGFTGLEIDIRKDKNGELIVFHDDDCNRLLGVPGNVDTMTVATLKKYPLLFKEQKFDTNVYITTVKELLDTFGKDFLFYFDMKLGDLKTADDMVSMIKSYHLEDKAILANSDAPFILYTEKNYPEITTALEGFNSGKEWLYYLIPRNLKPDYYSSFYWNIDKKHADWLKKENLLEHRIAYGMISNDIKPMMDFQVKNLIVDYDTSMSVVR